MWAIMVPNHHLETFKIWASDHMVYGPVDLSILTQWAKERRIFPKTWVHVIGLNRWCQAEAIEALNGFFVPDSPAIAANSRVKPDPEVLAEELRQFPLFSGLTNAQLNQFIGFGELVEAVRGKVILTRNDPSESLFFVLAGEVRARIVIGYEDRTLGKMQAGECFGEVAMFANTPRSADVVAESPCRLLRFTSEACLVLIDQLPQIAAPLLHGIAVMMASRMAERNQQLQKDAASEFLWR
jgi:Cyclic nucleotide-binding domain